ncbi:PH domain-containing protein [Candidatus Berkelbacteria bacterium]|nr:PH domain-containing protein [Candidatus Berkelbacteria bacterium]
MEAFFDGQRDHEEIVALWRRHPWTLAKPALGVVLLTLVVVASFRVFGASLVTSLVVGLWLIIVPAIIAYAWYRWWNDLYLLTNERLIDIDQRTLFHRAVAEAPLEHVQDVSFETRGVLPTLLNFGTVLVQTASVTTEIDMVGVTDPQAVQQTILRAADQARRAYRTTVRPEASRLTESAGQVPEGTITFLMSDIVGSSPLWEAFATVMPAVIAEHDRELAAIITRHHGVVFKTMGDSVCAAFETPAAAVTAAVELQRRVQKIRWSVLDPALPPIRVRVGVHSGAATVRGGDYLGPAVNRTARIAALGQPQDILLSEAAKTLVQDSLPAGVRLLDRGRKKLKGLARPEHIYQLAVDELSDLRKVRPA